MSVPNDEAAQNDNTVVCGKNAVLELLRSKTPVDTLYISSSEQEREFSHFAALAKEKGAVVKTLHPLKLDKLCAGSRHQGVAALCCVAQYVTVKDLLETARERGEDAFVIVADDIEDPHNLGAIIRTAECAGAHGVIIPKRGGCPVTATVARSSAGAAAHLPLARVANLASAIRELKDAGVFCYCADMDGEYCATADLTGPAALVVGSEGSGVSRLVKELCDKTVSLPIKGKVSSLNASVAAGALIYEIVRQRAMKSSAR